MRFKGVSVRFDGTCARGPSQALITGLLRRPAGTVEKRHRKVTTKLFPVILSLLYEW